MECVYFVVSQPRTLIAGLLSGFTGEGRNHVSLLLTPGDERMYSFARRLRYFPLVGGFVVERTDRGILARCAARSPFDLVAVALPEGGSAEIRRRLERFLSEPHGYKYNFLGLLPQLFRWEWERRRRFTCSQFCAYLLRGLVELPIGYSAMLPTDFYKLGEVVCTGHLAELLKKDFRI